jgi:zinc protease
LAYAATGTLVAGAGLDPGRVEVSVGTGVDQLDRAERVVREELERFAHDGPTEQEIEEARAFLLGTEALRRETSRQLAAIAADAAFYGLDGSLAAARASLLELDREAVTAAVQRHLDPQRLLVTRGIPA